MIMILDVIDKILKLLIRTIIIITASADYVEIKMKWLIAYKVNAPN